MTTILNGIEGDLIPFRMSKAERQAATKYNALRKNLKWDGVQLFRAKEAVVHPKPLPPRPEEPSKTRICPCCGSTVKVPQRKKRARHSLWATRKLKWWLYYGPGHITGGFSTKQKARDWYLRGGR